ncbi:hypothetical protein AKJ62_02235 [candidate division MSBL1 archaeon SCGC-AAA259D14]|uniref:Mandelate racemase/muconate lactonizing enzyme C-terminal domain-containing protein n=1 Tax=candidate division MSBL1 archaeon SCGC-AAA259D14 TaxID=1698261 RepID=A0A133U6L7_9EURY|nr:hypothetical protein AKJ62_02235 [candidate division MSBL1 archaeon SCGC-AAA259D14]
MRGRKLEIKEIEIREFNYLLQDISTHNGHHVFSPESKRKPPGFILTIKTEDGLEGNYRGFVHAPALAAQIRMVAQEFLLGRDPLEREKIWQDIWLSLRHIGHLGLGPIDIALWDLAGKYYEESIGSLIGGYKDHLPAYASTFWGDDSKNGLSDPEAYAKFAEECLKKGYRAFKIHPFGDPEKDIEVCKEVADRVGTKMDLMLDPASEYNTYSEAIKVGKAIDNLNFFWYEDPLRDMGESIHVAKQLTQTLKTPILGLEHSRTGSCGRANFMSQNALEMVRADAHLDGGITGVIKTANTAEAFGLDVELHLGGPSHLHCMSAIRNTNYFEHGLLHPRVRWINNQGFTEKIEQINSDGTLQVPQNPGLGVEIDWEFVNERETSREMIN